jgi:hypothetical protein
VQHDACQAPQDGGAVVPALDSGRTAAQIIGILLKKRAIEAIVTFLTPSGV